MLVAGGSAGVSPGNGWTVPWATIAGPLEIPEAFQARGGAGAAMASDGGHGTILVRRQGIGTAELEATTGRVIDRCTFNLADPQLDLSPLADGRLLVGQFVADRTTGAQLGELITNNSNVAGNTVMPGERVLAQATGDGLVLWSLGGHQLLERAAPRRGANYVCLDASGDRLALNAWGTGDYHLWDLSRSEELSAALDPTTWMIGWMPNGGFMTYETDGETKALDPQTFTETGRATDGSIPARGRSTPPVATTRWRPSAPTRQHRSG